MLPTLIGGLIPLAIALVFFGVLLSELYAPPLWIVVIGGIVLMIVTLIEAVRSGEGQFGEQGR